MHAFKVLIILSDQWRGQHRNFTRSFSLKRNNVKFFHSHLVLAKFTF